MKNKQNVIENAQNIVATISSEIYRLQELTVDDDLSDTVPSELIVRIEDLHNQLEIIDQDLQELYYNLSYQAPKYSNHDKLYTHVAKYL